MELLSDTTRSVTESIVSSNGKVSTLKEAKQKRLRKRLENEEMQTDLCPTQERTIDYTMTSKFNNQSSLLLARSMNPPSLDMKNARIIGLAREALMKYDGTIWDCIKNNDLQMFQNFVWIQGKEYILSLKNRERKNGYFSLLHYSVSCGSSSIAQCLLHLRANPDIIDNIYSKTTPLMIAARKGNRELCALLLFYGASLRMQDSHGDTALHWACRGNYADLVIFLVQYAEDCFPGASKGAFTITNLKGKLCLDLADSVKVHDLAWRILGVKVSETIIEVHNKNKISRRKTSILVLKKEDKEDKIKKEENDVSDDDWQSSDNEEAHRKASTAAAAEVEKTIYEELKRHTSGSVQDLSKLGLDLETFKYQTPVDHFIEISRNPDENNVI